MANQTSAVEINAFIKGIITEASPLTFPDNASIDEDNMVLNKDGSRRRRLGMDYEDDYQLFNSNSPQSDNIAFSSFVWKQPGGIAEKEFLAIQSGNRLTILDSTLKPISGNVLAIFDIGIDISKQMSMASVDGVLIVASGKGDINSFDYNGSAVVPNTGRLKIRDFFGVDDGLLVGSNVTVRPASLSQTHTYNLRNQTFAVPRYIRSEETLLDPIVDFSIFGVYQANSDNLITYLYADANDDDDRLSKRYWSDDNFNNPLGTNRAPMGYFIIDALDRGASRLSEYQKLMGQYPALIANVTSLPVDRTPDGASVVGSFAGRVWYGGFSSVVIGGDSESPRMTSYILFSKLVQNINDIYICYQEGDPTSSEMPELVDTDGGFLRLDGAYNIQYMINVGDALMVVAENGVWKITGGSGYGFNSTNYLTAKVSEHGSISPGSVVLIDNTFMYWSDDGIYHVAPNQYGDWNATNLTSTTIQTLFDKIPYFSKVRCQGAYDSYQRQVRWLYNNYFGAEGLPKELVLDVNLAAFYPTTIKPIIDSVYPKPLSIVKVPPFASMSASVDVVTLLGDTVVTSTDDIVSITEQSLISQTSELYYVVADSLVAGNIQLSLALYRDGHFKDWVSKDGIGVDAPAYLLTGWAGMGTFQRQKQAPYMTVYAIKTETGFTVDYEPVNPSSILIQGQWSWTNTVDSGKWSRQFQAYRHRRAWMPESNTDSFDNGNHVVTSKNKLRGRGSVLSLRFDTEPDKDFHLLGWSYIVNVTGSV